jgi:hypothetical protein
MTIKTNLKAGGPVIQHNETLAVRSDVKAGGVGLNHNETAGEPRYTEEGRVRRFSGTSSKGDFREALALAIAEAKQGLGITLVKWTLLLVTGVNGGFAGQNDLTVHIRAYAP